jgi:predicted GNAT family N-acyltransferase
MWQQAYNTSWAEVEGALVVRFDLSDEGVTGYMVVGSEHIDDSEESRNRLYSRLVADAEREGHPLRFVCMSSGAVEQFLRWADANYAVNQEGFNSVAGRRAFAVCDNPDYRDYIYSVDDLAQLSGRKYQPKRNHINRFESKYQYTFAPLTALDFEECLSLECRWQRQKMEPSQSAVEVRNRVEHECPPSEEHIAISRAFEAYDELGLVGGVLRVDGQVVAFTYGSPLSDSLFCTHIEKADADYEGAFQMINRCFAQMLQQMGFQQVNREEDMGIAGLRRAKQSYYPVLMQEKMSLRALTPREVSSRELWHEVFGDEREFIDLFMTEVYRPENMFVCEEQGRVVAMLHIVEMATSLGRAGYLYAIATAADYRGRGYASRLIGQALDVMRQRGYDVAMLIPASDELKGYYARFGFEDVAFPIDFSDGAYLGTGEVTADLAMVKTL